MESIVKSTRGVKLNLPDALLLVASWACLILSFS